MAAERPRASFTWASATSILTPESKTAADNVVMVFIISAFFVGEISATLSRLYGTGRLVKLSAHGAPCSAIVVRTGEVMSVKAAAPVDPVVFDFVPPEAVAVQPA